MARRWIMSPISPELSDALYFKDGSDAADYSISRCVRDIAACDGALSALIFRRHAKMTGFQPAFHLAASSISAASRPSTL